MPLLSLAMIVRNEERVLDRVLENIELHVDEIVIVDTGSTDKTREIAKRHGCKLFEFTRTAYPKSFYFDSKATGAPPPYTHQWTFADHCGARNMSFELTRGDVIMWLDADDLVIGGDALRPTARALLKSDRECAWLRYHFARDAKTKALVGTMWRERLVKRGRMSWVDRSHACLQPVQHGTPLRVENIHIEHHQDTERVTVPNRNLKIMLVQERDEIRKRGKPTPRTLFYLGQEWTGVDNAAAVECYERYLNAGGWDEERWTARIRLGKLLEQTAPARAAGHYAAAAVVERPDFPDGWFGLARLAYFAGEWQKCIAWSERGFLLGNPETVMPHDPRDRTLSPHWYYNVALNSLGRVAEALDSCLKGLAVAPDDGWLTKNRMLFEAHLARERTNAT